MRDSELSELSDTDKRIFRLLQKTGGTELDNVVEYISREANISEEEVSRTIYRLWKKGYIDLERPKPVKNIFSYLLSVDGIWFYILTILIASTIILVFLVDKPPLIYLRYILGSLYVLYLPGYTLIEALYPRGDELDPLERLALSIGLSLALVPLVGLVLNYTPWGIRLTPVTISLALIAEALALYALYRKYRYLRLGTRL